MAGLVVSPLDSWRGLLRAPLFRKPQLPNPSFPSPLRQVRMMGGGPRTFPGGVTKWQWKRMQEKKSKQLLKARLLRERQLYEMRMRAELRAATANLEKPWEKPAQAPTLFAVTADQQIKALADRFQKRGGIDLWTEKDGPESLASDEKPSVQSTTPYTRVVHSIDSGDARSSRSQQVSGSTPSRQRYDSLSSNQQQSDRNSIITRRTRNDNNTRKTTDFSAKCQTKPLAGSNLAKGDDSYSADAVYGISSNSRHHKERDSNARPGKYSQNPRDSNARRAQNPRDFNASPGKYSQNSRDYAENRQISSKLGRDPPKIHTLHSNDANPSQKRRDHAFAGFNLGKRSEQRLRWKHS